MEYTGRFTVGQRITLNGFTDVAKRNGITHLVEIKEVWNDEGRNGVTIEPVRGYGFPLDVREDVLEEQIVKEV